MGIRGEVRRLTTQPSAKTDPEFKARGVPVLIVAGLASTAMEAQVIRWREEVGKPLDWCFAGGRAVVLCFPEDRALYAKKLAFWGVTVMTP